MTLYSALLKAALSVGALKERQMASIGFYVIKGWEPPARDVLKAVADHYEWAALQDLASGLADQLNDLMNKVYGFAVRTLAEFADIQQAHRAAEAALVAAHGQPEDWAARFGDMVEGSRDPTKATK